MKRKVNISKKSLIAAVILLLAVCLAAVGGVVSKYVAELKNNTTPLTAKEFYFESNYLSEIGNEYVFNPGTGSISFELYNFDKNNRVSETDIKYTISVEPAVAINIETIAGSADIDGNSVTVGAGSKTPVRVILGNLADGGEYNVTVTANGGYTKTLKATFTVSEIPTGLYMNVSDTDPNVVILTVWTENISGDITVDFPAGLIPDGTDPMLAGIENYENDAYVSGSFADNESFDSAYSSRTYRFFKSGYTGADGFAIKLGVNGSIIDAMSTEIR